jgi:RNA polymerase sigma-70 factor (ECF subfamily)
VIVQLYFRDCSLREASTVLGVPEGTIKSRSYHALRALRKSFSDEAGVTKGVPE